MEGNSEEEHYSDSTSAYAGVGACSASCQRPPMKCNWDLELLEFLLDSFICIFPEREEERRRAAAAAAEAAAQTSDYEYQVSADSRLLRPTFSGSASSAASELDGGRTRAYSADDILCGAATAPSSPSAPTYRRVDGSFLQRCCATT